MVGTYVLNLSTLCELLCFNYFQKVVIGAKISNWACVNFVKVCLSMLFSNSDLSWPKHHIVLE